MKQKIIMLNEIKILGLKIKTNNETELNPDTSKISQLVKRYQETGLAKKINHRMSPNKTYSIYTEYESDETGEYSYFLGEEVSDFSDQDLTIFSPLIIPRQQYQCFTTDKGPLPKIIIDGWQEIWQMDASTLKGKRNYIVDFEVLDERCQNPLHAEADIYIGIES